MTENKKELLARLYALRAGLSSLSIEHGRIRGEDARARSVRTRIEDNTAELANYDSIVATSKKTYKSAKHDYNKAKRQYDKKSFPLLCWTVAMVCLAAAALYVYYIRTSVTENTYLYDIALGALGIGAVFSALKAALLGIKVRPLKKQMRKARELMLDSKTWIEESESGAVIVKEENRELKEVRRDLDASRDSSYAVSLPFANAFREALAETFSQYVGEDYYSALDFIIYEIKADAADDIPAALLAAEAKRRLDALEEAAYTAHERIRADIDADAEELSVQIDAHLSVLEEKLVARLDGVVRGIERGRVADLGGAAAVRAEFEKYCAAGVIRASLLLCSARPAFDMAVDIGCLAANKK